MPIVFKKSISFVLPYFISQQEFLFGQVLNWVFFSLFIFITHAHIIVIYFIHMSCILLFALFMNLWFHRYSQLICWKLFQWNFVEFMSDMSSPEHFLKTQDLGEGKEWDEGGRRGKEEGSRKKEASRIYACIFEFRASKHRMTSKHCTENLQLWCHENIAPDISEWKLRWFANSPINLRQSTSHSLLCIAA